MSVYQIEIESPQAETQTMSVKLLQALLSVIIEGSKGALRLRTEGRSMIRGVPPQWIKAATQFSMAFQQGQLQVESPKLFEVAPELFQHSDWFPELNPERTSLDYFHDSLAGATLPQTEENRETWDSLYDRPLLEAFQRFRHVFNQGVEKIRFLNGETLQITPETIFTFKERQVGIPFPSQVKVAGKLDGIRSYDRTFKMLPVQGNHIIKGIAKHIAPKEIQTLINKEILVSGVAYFTTSGKILRIEADQILIAGERELSLWGELPLPLPFKAKTSKYKVSPET